MDHMIVELFSGCVYLINNGLILNYGIYQSPNTNLTLPAAYTTEYAAVGIPNDRTGYSQINTKTLTTVNFGSSNRKKK